MFMLRSTHEKELLKSLEAARGAQKGLLRLQRRYKKLQAELADSNKEIIEYRKRRIADALRRPPPERQYDASLDK